MKTRLFVVALLLAASGVAVRTVGHGEPVALRRPFWQFPNQLGEWHGQDIRLTQRIETKVGVSSYLYKTFFVPDRTTPPVQLYVGFYESQKHGEVVHSPKNCLPGNGWFIAKRDNMTLSVPPYQPFDVNKFVITNGLERQVVLYWYQQGGGRVETNEYLGRVHLVLDALTKKRTDAALIRVIAPTADNDTASVEASTQQAVAFLKLAYPELMKFLPHDRPKLGA
jgi:EpsI family protein